MRRVLGLIAGSRVAIALSLGALIVCIAVLPGEFWVIPAAIILLDSFAPLRRVAGGLAALLLLTAVGRSVLLALSLLPFFGGVAIDETPVALAARSLIAGLGLASIVAIGMRLISVFPGARTKDPPGMSDIESQSVALMRLVTGAAFLSLWEGPRGLEVTGIAEIGIVYLVLIAAARSWPRASAAGAALIGVAVLVIGSAVFFLVMLGQTVSMHIDGGAENRRVIFRLTLTILMHWAMVAAAMWRFATRSKGASRSA